MKPRLVTMQAFGPYAERAECDFTSLYDSRIFLITGPTGSGKTAILDAMSFSLYGVSTGAARDFRDMRSTLAPDSLPTLTEFIFELGERAYKFSRGYRRRVKRTGVPEDQYEAECFERSDGEWRLLCAGPTKVSEKAQELLSFSSAQFSQVVVLPQGEFKKLLMANSKEKSAVLQVLFSAHKWQEVQNRLGARQKALQDSLKDARTRLETYFRAADARDAGQLEEVVSQARRRLAEAKARSKEQNEALSALQEEYGRQAQLWARFCEYEETLRAVKADEAAAPMLQIKLERVALARKAAAVCPVLEQKNAAEKGLADAVCEHETAEAGAQKAENAFSAADGLAPRLSQLQDRIKNLGDETAVMEGLLPDLRALADGGENAKALEQTLAGLRAGAEKREAELRELSRRIRKAEVYFSEQQEKLITPYSRWTKRQAEIAETLKALGEYEGAKDKAGERARLAESLKAALAQAQEVYDRALSKQDAARALARENAAHLLAAGLTEGAACPVCGSRHHPSPAPAPGSAGSKDDLEAAEREAARALERLNSARAEYAGAAAGLADAQSELMKFSVVSAQAGARERLESEAAALAEKIAESDRYQSGIEKLTAALEGLRRSREECAAMLEANRKQAETLVSQLAVLRARAQEIKARVGNADPGEFSAALARKKAEAGELQRECAQIQDARNKAALERAESLQRLRSAEKNLASARRQAAAAAEKFAAARAEYQLAEDFDFSAYKMTANETEALAAEAAEEERSAKARLAKKRQLEDLLDGAQKPELEALSARLEELKAQAEAQSVEKGKADTLFRTLEDILRKVRGIESDSAALDAEYSKVTRIHQLVSGPGNPYRINLQSFVLGLMLDEVVQEAGRYLSRLSRGRYSLVRVDEGDRRSLGGLDIEVCDAHLGAQRRVATLSGGELFLASLSLAFGLAEVVQAHAGGVRLDSIFIDEGFGSLDSETLESAMSALGEIQSEGRLVGVISHVAELRERIPARIEVGDGRLQVISG